MHSQNIPDGPRLRIGSVVRSNSNHCDGITFSMRSSNELVNGTIVSIIRISDFCSVIYVQDFDEYFLLNDLTYREFRAFLNHFIPDLSVHNYLRFIRNALSIFRDYLPDLSPAVMVFENEHTR